jgi:N,N-dimethylformamidase
LGGNGFYWVTSTDEERHWIVEVRRDNSGTRTWDSPVGERSHVFDNEIGGLWRFRGKSPHRTMGIGFGAEGFSGARPYTRQDASYSGPASQWFDGIRSDQLGERGYVLDGAAGDERDRWDPSWTSTLRHAPIISTFVGGNAQIKGEITPKEVDLGGSTTS